MSTADIPTSHPLDHVDLHCTVVTRAPFVELMRSAHERASAVGWSMGPVVVHDEEDDPIVGDLTDHTRTRGSLDYGTQTQQRRVFWSSGPRGTCCQFFGGVYIRQFAAVDEGLALASARAMDDMLVLFGGPETLCMVLGWEDDHAIDVGPGIVGVYRRTLWRECGAVAEPSATVRTRDGEWVEVRVEPSEQGRQAAQRIQAAIARALSRECGCDGLEA